MGEYWVSRKGMCNKQDVTELKVFDPVSAMFAWACICLDLLNVQNVEKISNCGKEGKKPVRKGSPMKSWSQHFISEDGLWV
jgi:hypothetical protein